ncbi:MAG: fibronectin type III domain-containing protein [Gammaproteobacteria bacterium]|nr:fibronectin type III domain-containing protein [Gammaproteobacteria bacterium]
MKTKRQALRFAGLLSFILLLQSCGSGVEEASRGSPSNKSAPIADVSGVWHARQVSLDSYLNPNLTESDLLSASAQHTRNVACENVPAVDDHALTLRMKSAGVYEFYMGKSLYSASYREGKLRVSGYSYGGTHANPFHQNISSAEFTVAGKSFSGEFAQEIRSPDAISGKAICTKTYSLSGSIKSANTPEAPSNFYPEALSAYRVALHWEDRSDNETGFEIYRSIFGTGNFSLLARVPANDTTYIDATLQANTAYAYRIVSYNSAGKSALGTPQYVELGAADTGAPSAPGNMVLKNIAVNQVLVTWQDKSDNEDFFEIQRADESVGTFITVALVPAGETEFVDKTVSASTGYSYRVYSIKGNSPQPVRSDTPTESDLITTLPVPGADAVAPGQINAQAVSPFRVALEWSHSGSNVDRFIVYRKLAGEAGDAQPIAVLGPEARSYSDNWNDATNKVIALLPETTYVYSVAAGYFNSVSGLSSEVETTTSSVPEDPSGVPLGFEVTPSASNAVLLSWQEAEDAEDSILYYDLIRTESGLAGGGREIAVLPSGVRAFLDTDPALQPNTSYTYQIIPVVVDKKVAGFTKSASTHDVAPQALAELRSTIITHLSIDLSWDLPPPTLSSGIVKNYIVEYSTSGEANDYSLVSALDQSASSVRHSGLQSDTNYIYRIKASNAYGESAYTYLGPVKTASTPPQKPTGLNFSDINYNSMRLNWAPSEGALGYRVYRSSGVSPDANLLISGANPLAANINTFLVGALKDKTEYFFKVVAVNNGNGYEVGVGAGVESDPQSETTLIAPPQKPSVYSVGSTANAVKFRWNIDQRAERYEIYRFTAATEPALVGEVDAGVSVGEFTDSQLQPNTLYYYFLRAINSTAQVDSNNWSVQTLTLPPVITLSATSETVTIDWKPIEGAIQYRVYRGTSAENVNSYIGSTSTETFFTDRRLNEGTTYFYKVSARNNSTQESFSEVVSIATKVLVDVYVEGVPGNAVNLAGDGLTFPCVVPVGDTFNSCSFGFSLGALVNIGVTTVLVIDGDEAEASGNGFSFCNNSLIVQGGCKFEASTSSYVNVFFN